jgi:hypothetical protein
VPDGIDVDRFRRDHRAPEDDRLEVKPAIMRKHGRRLRAVANRSARTRRSSMFTLYDARPLTRDSFGPFDASFGAFEHFCPAAFAHVLEQCSPAAAQIEYVWPGRMSICSAT